MDEKIYYPDSQNSKSFKIDKKKYNLEYINIWDPMLNQDGTRMPELFIEDGLHMNEKGYEVWTKKVRESLSKDFDL